VKRPLLALLWLLGGCPPAEGASVDNHCSRSSDCPEGSYCEAERGLCALEKTVASYPLVLQVSGLGGDPGPAGRFTFQPETLAGERLDRDLDVPRGVEVTGSVLGSGPDPKPVRAQVTFTPKGESTDSVRSPIVVTTSGRTDQPMNLVASLPPGLDYDVTIYPLNEASLLLPPVHTTLLRSESTFRFSYAEAYGDLEKLSATLHDAADLPPAPESGGELWLRVHAGDRRMADPAEQDPYARDQVVSSFGVLHADGSFEVSLLPGVKGVREYYVELNVFPEQPWATTIEFDATRIEQAEEGVVHIPTVPARVLLQNGVETAELSPAANANLVFESTFPLPEQPGVVNDRDWCQVKRLGDHGPAFRCRTLLASTTDPKGAFSVNLLPGDYRMYVSPSRKKAADPNRRTVFFDLNVDTQPGEGPQMGQVYTLKENALQVKGSVLGFSGPIRNAVVRLLPLGNQTNGEIDSETAYSRSSDAVSDHSGAFNIRVDDGLYDFIARAPDGSGYPWLYKANRLIEGMVQIGEFVLPPPVLVSGVVSMGGEPAPGARVDAYALVRQLGSGKRRGVLIGRATADAQGRYTLALPPSVADEP
jgi:hypothetical protein